MNRKLAILILISLSYAWDTPIKISEGVTGKGMYVDPSSSITHLAWCEQIEGTSDHYLFYKSISPNGTHSDKKQLDSVHGCTEVSITGRGYNGKSIMLAFSGARMGGEKSCTKQNSKGCIDLYFSESPDTGMTWSPPVAITRTDMNDLVIRNKAQLIHITETGRTWLFFMRKDTQQDSSTIFYAMRPPGSYSFAKEMIFIGGHKSYPSAAYTIDGNTRVMHVVWSEQVEEKWMGYYSKSLDNGATWATPISILRRDHGPPIMKLASEPKTTPSFLSLLMPDMVGNKFLVRWTNDHGQTWSTDTIALANFKSVDVVVCSVKKSGLMTDVFAYSTNTDSGEFGAFSMKIKAYVKGETPFSSIEEKSGPALGCLSMSSRSKFQVKALIAGGDTGNALYYSTQEYEPN